MNITAFIKKRIIEDFGSVRRFAKMIGIPVSTLTTALNKENGFNTMPVEKAIKVCQGLELNIEALYDYQFEPLTSDEKRLIDIYKNVTKNGKNLIMHTAENVKEFEDNQVITFMPMYREGKMEMQEIPYYDQAAGMGSGQVVDNPVPRKLVLPKMSVPEKTDFIIDVVGDSMEPTFSSNDRLYIHKQNTLEVGEIGVFSFEGEEMVKELGEGELISHNDKYDPIKINKNIYIQGKVLGKVEK